MSSFPRAARLLAVLALAASGVALPSVVEAAPRSTTVGTAAVQPRVVPGQVLVPAASVQRRRAVIVFDKNYARPFRSRVVWRSWTRAGAKARWKLAEEVSWRAGSGTGPRGTDGCVRNEGWLPHGDYSFVQQDRRDGNYIDGRVFQLENKRCRNGTLRQALFIHSEQTVTNGQCRDERGDQRCRWEVPAYNDYRSAGCIKMSPGDLAALTRRFHRYHDAGVRYPTSVVKVRVTG
ncbi:hypothetical protein [Nocardioides aurantiacus]|uniref:L,D-transpeptidase-like protein n=1 Tax=Nocardioides aurantiacus TaxID=86796 RepID=A0A3N2CYI7_9ACTN|nr:hypothetical protein [Nocardioides aurantiacus]ROR92601.1 hypothetical protein EDD33_3494 [Nocardioides aurantiacus]